MSEKQRTSVSSGDALSRREFMKAGALGLGALAAGVSPGLAAPTVQGGARPNFLFILCDQMNLDAMSALGNPHVSTPNLDRLAASGVTFMQSHSTNPVCSPARSSLMTSRMPVETGVVHNDLGIRPGMPNMGRWLGDEGGYETVYCGKWHLPHGYAPPGLDGFHVLPTGSGQGQGDDAWVSRTCEAYLRNRARSSASDPFLMVASFMQPHDICYWMINPRTLVPDELPFAELADQLPALPPNHKSFPAGPKRIGKGYAGFTTDEQWRYYLYCYYRMVEMLDADVGRLLDAMYDTGLAKDTVIVFTADHGEGAGRHSNVQKWHPYDESMKVPMLCSWPGHIREGLVDEEHLVCGLDLVPTLCDYAQIKTPPRALGRSLRPVLEGGSTSWREYVVSEWKGQGRIVRTPQYKYVCYEGDPAVQLFDMAKDPWEMVNLAEQPGHGDIIKDHQKLLADWNTQMDLAPVAG